jgi:hypothetical protein
MELYTGKLTNFVSPSIPRATVVLFAILETIFFCVWLKKKSAAELIYKESATSDNKLNPIFCFL